MKILIMIGYYQRPKLIRNALNSILKANEYHQDWTLAFGDDGSRIPGAPIVQEILKDHMDKVKLVQTGMALDDKLKLGIKIGSFANEAMRESDADIGILLCDDDELHPLYLKNLSKFFSSHPDALYCYSSIHLYNPLFQKSDDVFNLDNKYNQWSEPINPVNKVDASQVAWRLDCCKRHDAWFAESTKQVQDKPWTKDTDKSFFENLFVKCGLAHPTGFVSQYKGVHDYQLLWHKNVDENGLRAYDEMINAFAGEKF